MKVMIVSAFPPDPAPEANHALHLSEHLAKTGADVHVLCRKGSVSGETKGVSVHALMDNWSWSSLPLVNRALRDIRPDAVLILYLGWVYDYHPMVTFLPTLCHKVLPGIPCITQFENIDASVPPQPLRVAALRKAVELWVGRRHVHRHFGTLLSESDQVIVLSSPHRDRLATYHRSILDKTTILPPPPLTRICSDEPALARRRSREALGASDEDFVWVYWGYIYPGKGVETLFEAFRSASILAPHLKLVIAGGELEFPPGSQRCRDYHARVRMLPEQFGIAERVTWTGAFGWDSDAGSRHLLAADACVLPFDYGVTLNNSSLAAAAAHGLPIIGTDLNDGRDEMLEHGRNIYLCRPRDAAMLSAAMLLVATDRSVRERLRLGATSLARSWHQWGAATGRLTRLLQALARIDDSSARASRPATVSLGRVPITHSETGRRTTAPPRRSSTVRRSQQDRVAECTSIPRVSVVVAAYNVEPYISQCLDALVNQTLPGVELIVVNDASTDGTLEIIKAYEKAYPNIRLIECERNIGLASVRNVGMQAATGEYVAFADGDDWVDIRMCERLYERANADGSDVVIASATVFFEDRKTFAPLFDGPIREILPLRLRTLPTNLRNDPLLLLVEPVAWIKLYRRAFLENEGIMFEDGMNSYEDVCFHFSALFKASRISLSNEPISFYRQKRPGKISGRTNRKVFEVFSVFRKIRDNLDQWNASPEIWAMFLKISLRQYDWLIRDRLPREQRREFIGRVAEELRAVPEAAFSALIPYAPPHERIRLMCMRRSWLWAYRQAVAMRCPWYPLMDLSLPDRRRRLIRSAARRSVNTIRRRTANLVRAITDKAADLPQFRQSLEALRAEGQHIITHSRVCRGGAPLVVASRIEDEQYFFHTPNPEAGLADATWRVEHDFYLTRYATFRPGDVVIDVGAHLGVLSIHLAKKFPFITVFAIEPNPAHFECLLRNIEINGTENVVPIRKALSEDGKERTLYTDPQDGRWATVDQVTAGSRQFMYTTQVSSITLEQLYAQYGLEHCRLLKITAPGVTTRALRAFQRRRSVDLLCGEVDLDRCQRVQIEGESWRIARQHFWRTLVRDGGSAQTGWIQELPREPGWEPSAGRAAVAGTEALVYASQAVGEQRYVAEGIPAGISRAQGTSNGRSPTS